MGFFVSKAIPMGETMEIGEAREHIFGFVVLNDWSARVSETFFLAKNGSMGERVSNGLQYHEV
jgi:fumarylacetoacetase